MRCVIAITYAQQIWQRPEQTPPACRTLGRGQPNYDKTCKLCGQEEEDLEHFIVRCPELEGKRNPEIMEEGPPKT